MKTLTRFSVPMAVAAGAALAGCGLLELRNIDHVNFQLPKREYSLSTEDTRWKQPPPGGVPAVSCGAGGIVADCCNPDPRIPPIDCQTYPLSCDATNNTCALRFDYEQVSVIDLGSEVPALGNLQGTVLSEVILKRLDFTIKNALNISLPEVGIYVAPTSVTTAQGAMKIATLPSTSPGYEGTMEVTLDEAAQETFSTYARDFQTPFHIIMSTSVVLRGGEPTPTGKIDVSVGGLVEARF